MLHVVVCIKQVPDTTQVRIDPETNTLVREGIPAIINPFDMPAIEAGMQLKDRYGATVSLLCMGPPQASEALQKALSYGADRGVLLSDRALIGSDTLATSKALACGVEALGKEMPVDLVICGKLEKRRIRVRRVLEGAEEVLDAPLPALLTVLKELGEPRYASLPAVIRGLRTSIPVWGVKEIEVNTDEVGLAGSPTQVRRIFAPPQREPGEVVSADGEAEKIANLILDRLIEAGFVEG